MSKRRLQLKVGIFVLIGLVLAAAMVMRFSKGTGLSSTYRLQLEAHNAGGIIPGAAVLMAGVPIGSVTEIRLAPDGSKVTMIASIYSKYKISKNAIFGIATVGFLGDRFISVSPGPLDEGGKHPGFREDREVVQVEEAFDISAVAQSASTLMDRLAGTVAQLTNAIARLDKTLLAHENLTNLTETVVNLRRASDRAVAVVSNVNTLVQSNSSTLGGSVTNFYAFTEKLNRLAVDLQETVTTNKTELGQTMKSLQRSADRVDRILEDVQSGKGLAGNLLKNDEMANHAGVVISNFMVFSSNLNSRGVWGVFRKPKKKED